VAAPRSIEESGFRLSRYALGRNDGREVVIAGLVPAISLRCAPCPPAGTSPAMTVRGSVMALDISKKIFLISQCSFHEGRLPEAS
jgi:hypothetical protein